MKKILAATLIALFVLPFCYLIALSLATEWRFPNLMPTAWTLTHWLEISSSGNKWAEGAANSVLLAVMVASLSTFTGFLTAWALSAHPRRSLWLALAYLPYVFSPVIYAHCLKYFFNVANLSGTFIGVLLAQFILTYPFAILLFFNQFDPSLRAMEDLTYTLGGSQIAALKKVLIPVSRTAIWICLFQTFLISWFEYGLSAVIGLGQVRTLTIAIYQYIGESNQYVAALASCLVCLPPLILLWLNQQFVFRTSTI